jgi:regulator of sigma E protease
MAIVVAGPVANLLLAVLLFAGTYVVGVPDSARCWPSRREHAGSHCRASRSRCRGRGRWRRRRQLAGLALATAESAGHAEATVEVERQSASGQRERLPRSLSLAALTSADWEGNFMPTLGLKIDLARRSSIRSSREAGRARRLTHERSHLAVDGMQVRSPADVALRTNAKPGVRSRSGSRAIVPKFDATFNTEVSEQNGTKIGLAGVRLKIDPAVIERLQVTVRYGLFDAFAEGARKTWELSAFTLKMLGRIVIGEASLKNISGPITMADYAGQSAQAGGLVFVGYLALISISLGVLNLLPVPLLDGGHLLYYLAELIKGSPVSDRAFEIGQRIGMAMLAMLMALALFNDLSRLF